MLPRAVTTRDEKNRQVERWYYVDIQKALGTSEKREEAVITVISVPGSKVITGVFGREILPDLSERDKEYENQLFPLHLIFRSDEWCRNRTGHGPRRPEYGS